MTVEHEADDPYEYEDGDIEDLPDYQDIGGGVEEWNTPYESDVREIIENAAAEGDRLSFTVFDGENHLAYELFDKGMSADYMLERIDSLYGGDISGFLEEQSNGRFDAENIEFFQIHESDDWRALE